MRRKILSAILVLVVIGFAYNLFSGKKEPSVLTTNIDIDNKTITGTDSDNTGESDGSFYSLLGVISENISNSFYDDITMLAAAADPEVKFVKIDPGMRKEEIVNLVGQKLAWSDTEKNSFLNVNNTVDTTNAEGYYYPGTYLLSIKSGGYEVGRLMINRFNDEVMSRYASSTKKVVNVNTAMKIAAIIQREAAGKNDMRLISGIIWNRIFKDMTLDIDATLQYAKGNEENGWWPRVLLKDKLLASPYNTYKNKGLTPTPIANPQLAAIEAALNPKKTNCLFYLHDKYRRIHCTATYKEHVRNIERYYGG